MTLAERIRNTKDRIDAACIRAGRDSDDVLLVAVTKTVAPELINEAVRLGLGAIGENRVQEYLSKKPQLLPHAFHMVGHLQRNKAKYLIGNAVLIHSVDSEELLDEIQRRSQAASWNAEVLFEINVSGEASKHGIEPDSFLRFLGAVGKRANIAYRGLMTVGSLTENPETARSEFRSLRELRETAQSEFPWLDRFDHLSMGMSGDFETAIEEGATIVRVGTAIFGSRT